MFTQTIIGVTKIEFDRPITLPARERGALQIRITADELSIPLTLFFNPAKGFQIQGIEVLENILDKD